MLRNLRHYFHAQVKEIVERHDEPRYRLLQRLEVAGFLFYMVRYLAIIHMLQYDTQYYRLDFFAGLAHYGTFFNMYFFILLLALHVLALIGKKVFFFTHVNTLSFEIIYNICVVHTEIYWKHCKHDDEVRDIVTQRCQDKMRQVIAHYPSFVSYIPDALLKCLCHNWAWFEVWRALDCVDKQGFMRDRMPLFPNVSFQTRAVMILWLNILDSSIFALMIFCFILSMLAIFFYSCLLFPHYPWWYPVVFFTDIGFFLYLSISFVQCGVLFTLMATYCSVIYICHFNELSHIFANVRSRVRLHQLLSRMITPSVKYLIKQHSTIVYYIVYTNRDVWGNALLLYVTISIPVNAYMVSLTLMDTMTDFEVLLMLSIIVVHGILGAIPMVSVAYSIQANYQFKKYIIPIQSGLGRHRLTEKLKLEDIFGRMSHGRKYGLTIGPMASITFTYLFELVLTYVAMFLFVLDKKRELSKSSSEI